MKSFFGIFLAISIFSHLSAKAEQPLSCEEKYQQSTLSGTTEALTFLTEAYGDCDYESVDQMALYIRKDRALPAWTKESFEDPINCVLMRLVQAKVDVYCEEAMSLQTLQERISRKDLPNFLDENPDLRDWIPDWR